VTHRLDTLERMPSSRPTQAVANLHLHLEYDSGLDVMAAALDSAADVEGADGDAFRAHVSGDISNAVAHLLDVEALTPDGSPLRITEVGVEVMVDLHDHHHDGDDSGDVHEGDELTPAETLEAAAELLERFEDQASALSPDAYEAMLNAPRCAGIEWAFPTGAAPEGHEEGFAFTTQWGVALGFVWRACTVIVDELFDDVHHLRTTGAADAWRETSVISKLPNRFGEGYDAAFAQRFLAAMVGVTTKISGEWDTTITLAEDVAASLLVHRARAMAVEARVPMSYGFFEHLIGQLVEPDDLAYAFGESVSLEDEGVTASEFLDQWFEVEDLGLPVAPYAQHEVR
jgi:hypothetical protein